MSCRVLLYLFALGQTLCIDICRCCFVIWSYTMAAIFEIWRIRNRKSLNAVLHGTDRKSTDNEIIFDIDFQKTFGFVSTPKISLHSVVTLSSGKGMCAVETRLCFWSTKYAHSRLKTRNVEHWSPADRHIIIYLMQSKRIVASRRFRTDDTQCLTSNTNYEYIM